MMINVVFLLDKLLLFFPCLLKVPGSSLVLGGGPTKATNFETVIFIIAHEVASIVIVNSS